MKQVKESSLEDMITILRKTMYREAEIKILFSCGSGLAVQYRDVAFKYANEKYNWLNRYSIPRKMLFEAIPAIYQLIDPKIIKDILSESENN